MAKRKKLTYPLEVEWGNASVKVYKTTSSAGYSSFQIADYTTGKRKLISFSDEEETLKEAEELAKRLNRGEAGDLLRGTDARTYHAAVAKLPEGIDLLVAATRYADAYRALGGDFIMEAVRDFVKRHPVSLPKVTVKQVFDEFILAKEQRKENERTKKKGRDRYLGDLRSRCGRFAEDFQQTNIADLTTSQLQDWLDGLKLSPRSYINYRRVIGTMFEFAKRRGYLPKDHDELERVERIEDEGGDIEIYTGQEMIRLLHAAQKEMVPCLALGGFAGLRSSEILRLDWREVNLEDRFIEIKKGKTKTASRRIVPITDNLASWLANYVKKEGSIWTLGEDEYYKQQQETAAATKTEKHAAVEWKHNALRHSFISYRLAKIQNVAQVALEAGNSANVIHKHYRELVRPKDAEAWFAIEPAKAQGNIIPLAKAAAHRSAAAEG